ncbi:hypothetical protein PALB_520 [Pseudoalteromonas luteoviolacea B = ATCC 29581]|nr:hypothetical protein PALB_520 [Pseudoalteromonas luteoviolacea B = ATCC 29581]
MVPTWGDIPISLCEPIAELGGHVAQLQFYLSNFNVNGKPVDLLPDRSGSQIEQLVLVGGDCHTSQWDIEIPLNVRGSTLSFTLGVPFDVNHFNPLTQPSPLNVPEMFWTWQQGHKFLRLDVAHEDGGWEFHLGSIGCQSASVMRAPKASCSSPNRYEYTVLMDETLQINLDLKTLLNNVTVKTARACMGEIKDKHCQMVMTNLEKPIFRSGQ